MTTQDLSRKLYELCGIKPRYGVYENFGDLDDNFQLVTNERKYRLIADTRYHYGVEDEDLRNLEPKYYPDFTLPENFVKLFELNIPDSNVTVGAAVCFCNCQQLNNRNDFLQSVIQLTKDNTIIKHAIKSEGWKYE